MYGSQNLTHATTNSNLAVSFSAILLTAFLSRPVLSVNQKTRYRIIEFKQNMQDMHSYSASVVATPEVSCDNVFISFRC